MALVAGIIRVIAAFFDILAASASSTKKYIYLMVYIIFYLVFNIIY